MDEMVMAPSCVQSGSTPAEPTHVPLPSSTEGRTAEAEKVRAVSEARPRSPRYKPEGLSGEALDQHWKNYYADPGHEMRNALVEVYHGFAASVTRRFAARLPRSVDRGDLLTAGQVGLMNAVVGFDPERGVRFESYCELRVKGALLDELRTQDWLPRPWRQRMEHQKRAIEALRAREVREPTNGEVAEEMDLPIDLYHKLFGVGLPGTPSGSGGQRSDEDVMASLEVVPDESAVDPEEGLTRAELLSLVTQRLSEQEYRILYLRYWEGLAMREIGEMTGLSESRICKIHTRLIERLQDRLNANLEDE
ncbi:MAG: RNA polymerase sigma factor for flagellar operon FliA [Candidatus Paceibacteria bacterium]|jgi:RNA polymerase sigma factor for flagellar operon FliA